MITAHLIRYVRLKKLYGLKSALCQCFLKVNDFLLNQLGFSKGGHEPCFYDYRVNKILLLITLYVDDFLILGST